jgi:DNA-binding MarR family transcriptional regulator
VIRATPAGRNAQEIWRPLFGAIEKRWQERLGKDEIDQLRESQWALISQIDGQLPDCLPILSYGLFSKGPDPERSAPAEREDRGVARLPLPALLSRVLLAFAIEFERESELSLAISANVLRVLNEKGVRVRDLPLLIGVSKEAISMAMGILRKKDVAVVETDPAGSRAKSAGERALARTASARFESCLSGWSASPRRIRRRCSAGWILTPRGGELRCANPKRCRTILWCCTAADFLMAVDTRNNATVGAGIQFL